MKKSFLTLNGKEYRVEVNWNAVSNFLVAVGRDTLEGLSDIANMRPSDITSLMAAAINEGERLEGRECNLTPLEVGSIIRPTDVRLFMDIYIEQNRTQTATGEPEPQKKSENQPEES